MKPIRTPGSKPATRIALRSLLPCARAVSRGKVTACAMLPALWHFDSNQNRNAHVPGTGEGP
jgi:hypothetical protein